MKLYVNGVQEGSIAGPASIVTNNLGLGIGAQPDGISQLQGAMDDVHLYYRALSPREIQALALHPAGNSAPDAPTVPLPANGATGVSTLADPERGCLRPRQRPADGHLLRPAARERQLHPDRPAHGCRLGHRLDTDAWASLGAGQTSSGTRPSTTATHTRPGPTWTFHTTAERRPRLRRRRRHRDRARSPRTRQPATSSRASTATSSPPATTSIDSGTAAEFTNCYATTPWGDPSVKSRTRPVPGNHDWGTGRPGQPQRLLRLLRRAATDAGGKSYYSYDIAAQQLARRQPRQRVRSTCPAAAPPARRRSSGSRPTWPPTAPRT